MAYKLVIFPQAESDIAEALAYLSERAPQAARRWYALVKSEIESLVEMPARCPLSPEAPKLGADLRQLLYGKRPGIYRIVFRILEESREVHVIAVRHGARKPLDVAEIEPFLEL